ncbi:MAG: EpsI family protein [Omnitrophica WOR_2 bacterium RIFCSPHIGHO2_02_FULL_52_10]|nr:MAG: EpsI family protein [Omnitrophica WOR_2 bacterium RIFCSPHIGHO2_02_FULL_52_10]
MKKLDIDYWLILVIFCVVGLISWRVYFKNYRMSDTISIHLFPSSIGDWQSEEIPVSDYDKKLLETENVFVRRYTNPAGEEVFLFAVYSQNNRKVSHPPEICYAGAGAAILDNVPDAFYAAGNGLKIHVNRLTVEKGDVRQIFVYWFKVGETFTSNYWKQQALIAYKSLIGQPASSALIRISATVHHDDAEAATKLIKKFGQQIIPHLQTYLP